MIFDPNRLLRARFQDDLKVTQIVVLLMHVSFRRRDAAHETDEIEQARIMLCAAGAAAA
jgi:hypothetical protein